MLEVDCKRANQQKQKRPNNHIQSMSEMWRNGATDFILRKIFGKFMGDVGEKYHAMAPVIV